MRSRPLLAVHRIEKSRTRGTALDAPLINEPKGVVARFGDQPQHTRAGLRAEALQYGVRRRSHQLRRDNAGARAGR